MQTALRLRRTTWRDEGFRAMCAQLDGELRGEYGAEQAPYDAFNHIADIETVVVVELVVAAGAETRGAVVGGGCFRARSPDTIELKRVFVAPAARRRGAAREIVGELEAWARELGFRDALLETGSAQRAAIALYQRLGYRICEPFAPYVGMALSVCMHKRLGLH